ncbi:RidA family protein [Roseisalinus antarcticus]|uniref:2-aminomuconate deaminase n=1 Tax=Roseisalinus antarcticus TaxID=254357 RepID=A0A1Y5T3Y3_9RHOB|nr:RidA family protein [Roseisalinus antarcticus]SLN51812.1 2-aminomuconate deaminase [Roseisalinus antarcticus]
MPLTKPFKTSPSNPAVSEIQTRPERIADMPYAPAIRVMAGTNMLWISGATASDLYHKHPHDFSEHDHSARIEDQVHNAMANIKEILDQEGLTWTDIVFSRKYMTDMRDFETIMMTLKEYFGDWTPASTAICVNALSTPGARIELEMVAAYPE